MAKPTTKTPPPISKVFQKYFGQKNGIDLPLSDRHEPHDPIKILEKMHQLRQNLPIINMTDAQLKKIKEERRE